MADTRRHTSEDPRAPGAPLDAAPAARRSYTSPVLTEYGRVDDLIDAGAVGQWVPVSVPTV